MKRALGLLFAVAACRSSASHFYTLVAPAGDAPVPPAVALQLDVLPVDVPPEVDRAQMVVRRSAGEVTPVDTRSWIAPLPLEIRRALSDDLTRALGARDIAGLSPSDGVPTYRVKLVVQRFESELGQRARIDATWSIREAGGAAPALTCTTHAEEPAAGDYDAMAEAHQRALAKIAGAIATAVKGAAAGRLTCGDDPVRSPPTS